MARISGIDLPKNKRGEIALTYVYGIGYTTAKKILAFAKVEPNTKVKDWTDEQINGILTYIADHLKVEGELRGEVQSNIKRLQDIENISNSFAGVEKTYALAAGREVRTFVYPDKINDVEAKELARSIALRIEQELKYPGEIRVMVIRETRVIEYAR